MRSRSRAHVCAFTGREKADHTPTADYPWRCEIAAAELSDMLSRWGDAIDYSNFKAEVDRRADEGTVESGYASALHRIWSDLRSGMREP